MYCTKAVMHKALVPRTTVKQLCKLSNLNVSDNLQRELEALKRKSSQIFFFKWLNTVRRWAVKYDSFCWRSGWDQINLGLLPFDILHACGFQVWIAGRCWTLSEERVRHFVTERGKTSAAEIWTLPRLLFKYSYDIGKSETPFSARGNSLVTSAAGQSMLPEKTGCLLMFARNCQSNQ